MRNVYFNHDGSVDDLISHYSHVLLVNMGAQNRLECLVFARFRYILQILAHDQQ
ncbi:Uncharacterised protein [Leuconostoc mesenteroides]|jgi:hypothetical protein|nr:Uncharacterised protein [Leuconostoc mesenteroides]